MSGDWRILGKYNRDSKKGLTFVEDVFYLLLDLCWGFVSAKLDENNLMTTYSLTSSYSSYSSCLCCFSSYLDTGKPMPGQQVK